MPKPITPANWQIIRRHFRRSFSSNLHVAIATAGADGQTTIAPIGSFLLDRDSASGLYFEIFTTSVSKNAPANRRVCVMSVDSGRWLWLRAFFSGKFDRPPMFKIYGEIGDRRAPTTQEIARLKKRFGWLWHTPGGKKLWGNLNFVREIHFDSFDAAKLGGMIAWKDDALQEQAGGISGTIKI
ncbi:MAG: hypothetical protein IPH12_12635 [Saprospirales bacterium]|jgi:hypothetical protein|nr:hypothetical protein [Saprospirales bacterium]MBK8921206.1 hypothetical protein [Saprospirales bacterium]